MNIKQLIDYGEKELIKNNIDEALLKSKILMEYCLGKTREYILINLSKEIDDTVEEKFKELINRAIKNEPIQYILGKQEFMGLEFKVNENVLIPRADTEILVLETIDIINNFINKKEKINVLDMCTGSGAIIISLAKYLKNENINFYASDISEKAIDVAIRNSKKNEVKVEFIKSNLFEKIENIKFDLIVSNPPYIETDIINNLNEDVKNEPIIALDGGEDGLEFYRKIAKDAKYFLEDNGYLCLEIGYNQRENVIEILKSNNYKDIYYKKDLSQNDRIVICRKG
ncbi:MAG: peptide chain release factor N(5)-glutamine methyltransferase [Clostridia bacterium]|nr:peptide chain release factor N(5)-glutamine methyltransferase [Clostridia bacterium]